MTFSKQILLPLQIEPFRKTIVATESIGQPLQLKSRKDWYPDKFDI